MALEIFGSPQRVAIPVGYIVEKPVSITVAPPEVKIAPPEVKVAPPRVKIAPPEVKVAPPEVEVAVEEFPWEKYIPWALAALVIVGA